MATFNYNTKYNKILSDASENPNGKYNVKRLTVEEYIDLLHHSHNIEDLSMPSNEIGVEKKFSMAIFDEKIQNLRAYLDQINSKIALMDETIQATQSEQEQIQDQGVGIGDYDVTTPGIQDAQGNTLDSESALPGFTFTEIGG